MKTNLEILNEISVKLEGQDNATSITEALNNIANALGDDNPDKIISVSNSLEDILSVAGEGGGIQLTPKVTATIVNPTNSSMQVVTDNPTLVDNHLETYCPYTVEANGELEIILVIPKRWYKGDNIYSYTITGVDSNDYLYYGVISDTVNMAFDDSVGMAITDPTQDASCTITMTLSN